MPADIPLVAHFANLQKLGLTLSFLPDFRPLLKLKHVEDLHLDVKGEASCADLLHVGRTRLLHITLSATSWDQRTYHALSNLSCLQMLKITQNGLNSRKASVLAGLLVPHSIHVVLTAARTSSYAAMEALSAGPAMITHLTLHWIDAGLCARVHTMRHLVSFTFVHTAYRLRICFPAQA